MPKSQPANLRTAERSQTTKPLYLYYWDYLGVKYYYTNSDQDVIVVGGPGAKMTDPQTFLSAQIAHQRPEQNTELQPRQVTISLAAIDTELRKYFLISPTKQISVEIYRVNKAALFGISANYTNDLYLEFKGLVDSIGFDDDVISANCITQLLQEDRVIPRHYYQKTCNHQLYGVGCTLNKALFKLTTTIAANNRTNKSIDITPTSVNVDSPSRAVTITATTFENGYVDLAGDLIGIISSEVLPAGAGTRLYLAWWPSSIANGTSIDVYLGCRRIVPDCSTVFNNLPNFGGMPYIPINNPAVDGIHT